MLIEFYNLSAALTAELEEARKINEISEKALKIAREAAEELSKCLEKKSPEELKKKPKKNKISSNFILTDS
jgi:hypothetical protein